jgi:hypothetical protein
MLIRIILCVSCVLLVLGCVDRRTSQGIVVPQDWGVDRGERPSFFAECNVEAFPAVYAEASASHGRGSRLIVFRGGGRSAMKAAPFDIDDASTAQLVNWINDPSYYYAGIDYRDASGEGKLRLFRPTPAGYKVHEYELSMMDDGRGIIVQSSASGNDGRMEMRLVNKLEAGSDYEVTGPEMAW